MNLFHITTTVDYQSLFIVTGARISLLIQTLAHAIILLFNRVLKNKHRAVSQGVRRFGKRSICIDM
jgi:hypothetical protein